MTIDNNEPPEWLGESNEEKTPTVTRQEKDKQEAQTPQAKSTTEGGTVSGLQAEYTEAKRRFNSREPVASQHPHPDHADLFLACISQQYNAEVQAALSEHQLAGRTLDTFNLDKSNVNFLWQLLDDQKDTIDGEKVPNPFGAKALHGSFSDHNRTLLQYNARGSGPCIGINEFRGTQRANDSVSACRAIWVEDDEKHPRPRPQKEFPIPYSLVIESSSGKYHYYWLTYTEDTRTWARLQKEVMHGQFKSDEGANGLNRAMRIPGFWHKKTRPFPTRVAYMLDQESLEMIPDEAHDFPIHWANSVKRYDWEEIIDTFGSFLNEVEDYNPTVSTFDPIKTMEKVFQSEDFHGSLHALCMHFANFVQDPVYVSNIIQSLLCRVPESERDTRWHARFNDIPRSADKAVQHKLQELTNQTTGPAEAAQSLNTDAIDYRTSDWVLDFPDISGGCVPLDMLMNDFDKMLAQPIKAFNFAAIMSLFCSAVQNIAIMPSMATRKANGCHLLLAPSTGGKDVNISGPLRALAQQLLEGKYLQATDDRSYAILNSFNVMNTEITSLSAFHQWANDDIHQFGAIWSNTECTSIIAKMSDENANVANLAEIVINIQDGTPIPVVHKATKKDSTPQQALNEAYSLLFATQPATIQKHMNSRLLYKGVIGRFDYYIPDRPLNNDYVSTLSAENIQPYAFGKETLEFLSYLFTVCSNHIVACTTDKLNFRGRELVVKYDEGDLTPRDIEYDQRKVSNGPNRQALVDWDKETGKKYWSDDPDFNIFINRVPMSAERHLTILGIVQHVYQCWKEGTKPFTTEIHATPHLINTIKSIGNYQFEVRANRVWSLINRGKGLDDKHQAMLDAIKEADSNPKRWTKHIHTNKEAIEHLYDKEKFISIGGVTRCLARDAQVSTRDGIQICQALADYGYVEFIRAKQVPVNISDKPVKNVVRLTAQGRT